MERENNKKKYKKKEKLLLQTSAQSSDESPKPLQDFNRIPRRNNTTKNFSSICYSSKSSSISTEAPKCCLGFLLSSSSSNASSSSKSHLRRKPKSFSKITNKPVHNKTPKSAPNSTRPRSEPCKENDFPKPSSQNSKKNPSFLSHWHSGKKPTSKTFQRSKLSSALVKNLENPASGSESFGINQKDLEQGDQESRCLGEPTDFNFNVLVVADNLDNDENFTPAGKLTCWPSLNYAIVDDKPVEEDSNSANSTVVKTPPIEASVSPEVQCGSSNILLSSTVTPVCYGAGHLISGVTDRRKCKPRGILTVGGPSFSSGCGKINVCEDYSNENADEVFTQSRTSFIPLPAEASMRWMLPSKGKEDDFKKDDNASAYRPFMDSASMCVSSSPSSCCQFHSDLVSDSGDRNNSCSPDAITSTGKTRIVLLSPKRIPNFQGCSETSCGKYGDSSVTPEARSSCKTDNMQKGEDSSYGFIGEKTPSSDDPLSSSNILQTPTSESSQERRVGLSWIDKDDCQRNEFNPELCSVADVFHRTSVSPRSQMPALDPPGLSSQFTNLTSSSHSIYRIQLQKNLDNCASWISDSTVGNVSLSQMRISWREGLVSRICDIDELDCCRCLSDEENNDERSDEFQHKSPKDFGIKEHDSFRKAGLQSPDFLEEEPEILRKGKKALSPVRPNICAESICTDAGGLVASEDSDWALCYKNQLFEI